MEKTGYTNELKESKKAHPTIQLKGIWKGTVTDNDIRKARKELLKTLEEKW